MSVVGDKRRIMEQGKEENGTRKKRKSETLVYTCHLEFRSPAERGNLIRALDTWALGTGRVTLRCLVGCRRYKKIVCARQTAGFVDGIVIIADDFPASVAYSLSKTFR